MKPTYVKTGLKSLVNISKIVTIHYYEFDESFVFNGESHDFWEMVYVDKGKVAVRCDETETVLCQGEIIFHRPNEFHSIRAYESAPDFFVVSFECNSPAMQYLERYHRTLDTKLKSFITSVIRESESTYIIPKNDTALKKLNRKDDAPIGGEQLIKTYLEQLMIFLIRGITNSGDSAVFPSKESMEDHLVTAIKSIAAERVYERVGVGEICTALGYSKSYLSKLFRTQTGDTIANCALKMKIDEAKRMIRSGKQNFAQISDCLSFDNPQYFSRVFKRITGMTPTEFKKSLDVR